MSIRLLYFAGLREALGLSSEDIALPKAVGDVAALRAHLAARGEPWQLLLRSQSLRTAVNQRMVGGETRVQEGDEIAFFPPVTGG